MSVIQEIFGVNRWLRDLAQRLFGNLKVTIHVYSEMDHAFAREGGKHYNRDAAQAVNDRSFAFLRQHLT